MKLNPPASSSDLDAARAIARRLHRRAQGHERASDADAREAPAPPPVSPPEATPAPEPRSSEPAPPEETPVEPAAPEPPEGDDPSSRYPEPEESGPDLSDSQPLESEPPPGEAAGPAPWEDTDEEAGPQTGIDPEDAFGDLGSAESADALEDLAPPPGAESPEDLVGAAPAPEWNEDTPFEVEIETEEPERAPDDLVATPTPSWDDVADSCLALAQAHGTMFVDHSGQVITARGEWPEPGPEAIGGRLVSMMERTLQDAPTRSVSAPLAGQHLTAWRVPAMEGFLTVVFMGDVPLGVDVRPSVDAEIAQALGE